MRSRFVNLLLESFSALVFMELMLRVFDTLRVFSFNLSLV